MEELTEMVLRTNSDLHEQQIQALAKRPNTSSYLHKTDCPVLLVVGHEYLWSPVSQHKDMLDLLKNAKLEIIEYAGYFAPVEKPEECAQLCSDFQNLPNGT